MSKQAAQNPFNLNGSLIFEVLNNRVSSREHNKNKRKTSNSSIIFFLLILNKTYLIVDRIDHTVFEAVSPSEDDSSLSDESKTSSIVFSSVLYSTPHFVAIFFSSSFPSFTKDV